MATESTNCARTWVLEISSWEAIKARRAGVEAQFVPTASTAWLRTAPMIKNSHYHFEPLAEAPRTSEESAVLLLLRYNRLMPRPLLAAAVVIGLTLLISSTSFANAQSTQQKDT